MREINEENKMTKNEEMVLDFLKLILGIVIVAIIVMMIIFFWIPVGDYMLKILPSFNSFIYAIISLFTFGILVKIFSLFSKVLGVLFTKDKISRLKDVNDTILCLIMLPAGAIVLKTFLDLHLFANDRPYNPDNIFSTMLFSLGNYFIEKNYFIYLIIFFLIFFCFFRMFIKMNNISLEEDKKDEIIISKKDIFYFKLFGFMALIFALVGTFCLFSWFLMLLRVGSFYE